MCITLLLYIFSIQYLMIVSYDPPIDHVNTDENPPKR